MTDAGQSMQVGDAREVDVASIEKELTSLWKRAGGEHDPGDAPVMRACSMNLIVVTDEETEADELAALVGEITVEHPARIFLVVADRANGSPRLESWISARCSLPVPGGRQVCCEQISLRAAGTEANKIPSIIISLLVADMPVVLLWEGDVSTRDPVLAALARVADRVIIDSSADPSSPRTFFEWGAFVRDAGGHTTFSDLAWTHVTPWRAVLAQLFQPADTRPHLSAIDSVSIEYSSTSTPRHYGLGQSILLAGWLAERLRWLMVYPFQHRREGDYASTFRMGERAITIRLVQVVARPGRPGGIESVSLHAAGGFQLTVRTTSHAGCLRVTRDIAGPSRDEMISTNADRSEAALIADELGITRRDVRYEEALKMANATLTELLV